MNEDRQYSSPLSCAPSLRTSQGTLESINLPQTRRVGGKDLSMKVASGTREDRLRRIGVRTLPAQIGGGGGREDPIGPNEDKHLMIAATTTKILPKKAKLSRNSFLPFSSRAAGIVADGGQSKTSGPVRKRNEQRKDVSTDQLWP